jgi:hypothetical protein
MPSRRAMKPTRFPRPRLPTNADRAVAVIAVEMVAEVVTVSEVVAVAEIVAGGPKDAVVATIAAMTTTGAAVIDVEAVTVGRTGVDTEADRLIRRFITAPDKRDHIAARGSILARRTAFAWADRKQAVRSMQGCAKSNASSTCYWPGRTASEGEPFRVDRDNPANGRPSLVRGAAKATADPRIGPVNVGRRGADLAVLGSTEVVAEGAGQPAVVQAVTVQAAEVQVVRGNSAAPSVAAADSASEGLRADRSDDPADRRKVAHVATANGVKRAVAGKNAVAEAMTNATHAAVEDAKVAAPARLNDRSSN